MRLGEPLAEIGASASDYLRASAGALTSRRSPPPLDRVEAALAAYASEMTAIRDQGLTRSLPSGEVERLFTLGFALQQLREDLAELADCLQDWARDHQHPVTSAPSHPESPAPPRDTGPTTRLPRNI
jgi:hypothetical protein